MTYKQRLMIEAKYYDGVPCACVDCTRRRLVKERDRRREMRACRAVLNAAVIPPAPVETVH